MNSLNRDYPQNIKRAVRCASETGRRPISAAASIAFVMALAGAWPEPVVAQQAVRLSIGEAFAYETCPAAQQQVKHAEFSVQLVRPPGQFGLVTVDYETRDGTALAGIDYHPQSGTLQFGLFQSTLTLTIDIIRRDGPPPANSSYQDFFVDLYNPGIGVDVMDPEGMATIWRIGASDELCYGGKSSPPKKEDIGGIKPFPDAGTDLDKMCKELYGIDQPNYMEPLRPWCD